MAGSIWYTRFDELLETVEKKRDRYITRCEELGAVPHELQKELWLDLVSRIVHESNWQESLYLGIAETRELTSLAFDGPIQVKGPHLDVNGICKIHRDGVVRMKRKKATAEEIAAFNLSVAHSAVVWISLALRQRIAAGMVRALEGINKFVEENPEHTKIKEVLKDEAVRRGMATAEAMLRDQTPMAAPFFGDYKTDGELMAALSHLKEWDASTPVEYIHMLHRLTTMGLIPVARGGAFRQTAVHIPGNPNLMFPVPSLVPQLMKEYCAKFPAPLVADAGRLILLAAEYSHRFVAIHPYVDGNGRVSRLLMNLILQCRYVPVYLKADKTGRHRYSQALRRADNGKIKPLACLILMSLDAIYDRLFATVTYPSNGKKAK